MEIYSQKVLDYFKKAPNFGKIKKADAVGITDNIICGDSMKLYLKIGKNKEKKEIIKDIKFETFGCVAAIATSAALSDLVKGKSLEFALGLKKEDIIEKLEGLPPLKIHCSLLALDALFEALYHYFKKKKREIPLHVLEVHKKIEKEKEFIKKRYKTWFEGEDKMKKINKKNK